MKVVNGLLVVSQTELILQQIENFLGDLESNFFNKSKRGNKVRTSSKKSDRQSGAKDPTDDPFGADAGDLVRVLLNGKLSFRVDFETQGGCEANGPQHP